MSNIPGDYSGVHQWADSRLFHLNLLSMPLLVIQLGFQADHLPCLFGARVCFPALLLALTLMVVKATAIAFTKELNILILRLQYRNKTL